MAKKGAIKFVLMALVDSCELIFISRDYCHLYYPNGDLQGNFKLQQLVGITT